MKTPNRRSLPFWVSLAATFLTVTLVLPACAQAPAKTTTTTPTAPNQPAPVQSSQADKTVAESTVPNRAEAYYHDGLAAIYEEQALTRGNQADATRAIEEYKYALNDDPNSAELQNGLADLYFRTGRMEEAKATVEGLLKTQPDNIAANKLLGRIYLSELGQQESFSSASKPNSTLTKAIAQFERLVSLEPKNVDDRMVLGQLYTVNHQTDKAEAEFKQAQAIEPDSEEVVLNLARLYAENGNLKQAANVIEAVSPDNRTPKMEFTLGAIYQQMKDSQGAVKAFQRAYDMDPNNVRAQDALAQALLNNNQLDEALKQFQQLAKDDPQNASVLVHIAEIQRRLGNYKDALTTIQKARQLDPTNLEAGYNEGILLDVLGRFDDAAKTYQKMVDLTSHANGAYTAEEKNNRSIFLEKLGNLYEEQNKIDLAIATFQKMVEMGGDSAIRGYENQIEAYQGAHEFNKAIAVTNTAVAAHPNNRDLKLILAGELADQGQQTENEEQIDKAFAMAKGLLNNTPADLTVWESMAQMNIRLKRWKDAEENLNKAEPLATKKEDKVYLLFLRGEWAERQKHIEPAERYFRQALALDPDNAMTLNYLGYMLADRGMKLPEALKLIQKAVNQQPANAAYLDSLGWVYYKMGDYELAETNLRSAVERDQTDGTVHMHLGDLYEKTGRIRLAAAQWKLSLANFAKSNKADFEASDVTRIQKKLDSARVKLAKEDSEIGQSKPQN